MTRNASVEEVLLHIQAQSTDQQCDLLDLTKWLHDNSSALFDFDEAVINSIISSLDAEIHTLALLHLLAQKTKTHQRMQGGGVFLEQVEMVFSLGSANQIQIVPIEVNTVCRTYLDICIESGNPARAVCALRRASAKIQPTATTITAIHSMLMQACLLSKMYFAAEDTLSSLLIEIDRPRTDVCALDVLTYHYYGGMVLAGLKRMPEALEFFKVCVTAPAHAVSAVVVEAYKKYSLIHLLVKGKRGSVPEAASLTVSRALKQSGGAYNAFGSQFEMHDLTALTTVAKKYEETFVKDNNWGLVKQCLSSLTSRNIRRLTQTYLTLSLAGIAKAVELKDADEAEVVVIKMIEAGEISARIDAKAGMVSFLDDSRTFCTAEAADEFSSRIERVIRLSKTLKLLDEDVSSSPLYMTKLGGGSRGLRRRGMGGMMLDMDDDDDDEDMDGGYRTGVLTTGGMLDDMDEMYNA
eukprot:TRINITY_DN302_c6_g1_i2.p1 TRINITY_DN302_c6_g1~~TRINITY_DN302_c6_g1_i2.p1  ORF type:complete len:466 (+),score=148.42 TRINITY_DN302_c6_g1_i2:535-1932(+)